MRANQKKNNRMAAHWLIILLICCLTAGAGGVFPQFAHGSSMDELVNQFSQDYQSLIPEKNSSVHTDYKLEQAALGTFYTTKALDLIYKQNQEMSRKYDRVIEKVDEMIEQNKELIRLLTIISVKDKEEGEKSLEGPREEGD